MKKTSCLDLVAMFVTVADKQAQAQHQQGLSQAHPPPYGYHESCRRWLKKSTGFGRNMRMSMVVNWCWWESPCPKRRPCL